MHFLSCEFATSVDGHLDCVQALTAMNRSAMNIHVQMVLKTCVSSLLGYKP